jgi:Ca2+-binding RTX toxin-like protein
LNSDQAAVQIGFTAPVTVVGSNEDDEDGQPEPHTVPNPNEEDSGPILGGAGADVLIGDLGGAIVGDLNVAIIIDISGSMVDPDNNPAPGVTRLDVIQDALEEILPQLAGRDATVNLFIETFARDSNDPLFIGELTTDNVEDIIVDIFALDSEAAGFTNYEAALTDMRDWYLGQLAATDGFTNVAFFLTDGFPNRSLDDNGEVQGTGLLFQQDALDEALAAIPDVLDQSSGVFSGDDQILLNAIGTSNALESTLDQLDTTGGAELVDLGDPSTVPDAFAISGVNVGSDVISGGAGDDIIFGDVPNSDALALAEGIDLPLESGFAVFQALEAGQSPSSPGWGRGDTIAYLRDPANQSDLIGAGRGEGDTIDAGAGNDLIFAQGGDDSLTGGTGADTFLYTLAADEGDDEILDFSTAEGDVLSFVNVTDTDASGTIGIEDVVDSFIDGGGAGAVDTVVLASGTTIMITDVSGGLTDLNSLEANTLINAAMA